MKLYLHSTHNAIVESHTVPSAPKILDEIDALADTIQANIGKEVRIPKDVLDSFMIKDTLNQDIWQDDILNPKVRAKLIQVANDFYKDLNLPKEAVIKDIIFTGSLANFNWSKFSDIDLHIVLDFNQFDAEHQMVEDYFYAQKSIWNQEHDITIYGFPIELYVQDVNAKLVATAVYSVLNNKWIKQPQREAFDLDKKAIKDKADKIIYNLRDIRQDYQDHQYQSVVTKVKKLKDAIKRMRNAGLEKGGEYSQENLVFKVLRRTPFMDQLDSFKAKAYDKLMSVSEVMTEDSTSALPKPSEEDIKKIFYTGEGFFDPKHAAIYAKKYLGIKLTKVIGYGGNGAAYLTSTGTKLKFTFNENEYVFAKRSIGKKNDFMADYLKADAINDDIFIIEMEYIDALSPKEQRALQKMFDNYHSGKPYDKDLKAKVDLIKSRVGLFANDLGNWENFGSKNGQLATFDPVSENTKELNETDNLYKVGGVLLIKGARLEDGTQRLYITATRNILGLERLKVDDTKGKPATMAVLGNQVYRVNIVDGRLKAQGVAWTNEGSMLKHLGLTRRDVALNNNKTPLHWETLKSNNIGQALHQLQGQILGLQNIKFN